MLDKTVSDLVFSYVNFPQGMNTGGWSKCYCEVCGDGKRTKGPRGGWSFTDDMAFYHCFNCGVDANFDPNREFPFSKEMRNVFDSFGIPDKEYNFIAYSKINEGKDGKKPERKQAVTTYFPIPDHFYKLADASISNKTAVEARLFLKDKYALSQDDYTFYLSTGEYEGDDVRQKAIAKSLASRIIIPYFKHGKLIYWQARAMNSINPKKYLNMDTPKTNVLFNIDALYKNLDRPLYVCEGAFDAIHIQGIAVMENNMTGNQIELLNKSPRQKVIVPDRKGDSSKLIRMGVMEQGWGIALPELGRDSKDICDGILKFGKLHILQSLVKHTYYGREAQLRSQFVM